MAWSQLRFCYRRLSICRQSDNQLSYEIKRLVGERPTPPAVKILLQQVSERIDSFRPKACAAVLHSVSKLSSSDANNTAQVLIDRFRRLCQQKSNFTATDLAIACNGLSRMRSLESHMALSLAANRASQITNSFSKSELIICLRSFIRSKIQIEQEALTALNARILELIEQFSMSDLVTVVIFCSRHSETSASSANAMKRIAALPAKLDPINIAAIVNAVPRDMIPIDILRVFESRALKLAHRTDPPALPILLQFFASCDPAEHHTLIKALMRRSCVIINRFNQQDISMVMRSTSFCSHYDLRTFARRANSIIGEFDPIGLSNVIKGIAQLPPDEEENRILVMDILSQIDKIFPRCSAKELSLLTHSVSHLEMALDDPLKLKLADQISAKLQDMNSTDLSFIARSSASIGLDPEIIHQILSRTAQNCASLNESDILNILWVIPRWKLELEASHLMAIAKRTKEILETARVRPKTLAYCAHAMVESNLFSQIIPHELILKLSAQLAAEFQSGELVLLLSSLYKLKPEPESYSSLCCRLKQLLHGMEAEKLVSAFWSLVSARFDAGGVFQDMLECISPCIPDLSAKGLTKLLWAGSWSQVENFEAISDAAVDTWIRRDDLKNQSQLCSAVLFALAITDSTHISNNHIRDLWSRTLTGFERDYACCNPVDQRNSWLSKLWLAFQWCNLRFPNVMGSLDLEKSQRLVSIMRNAMLSESPRLESDDQHLQHEIADAIRNAIGKDKVQFEHQCPSTRYLIDIVIDGRLALEVDGSSHYFGNRLNGPSKLKTLLLRQAGWKVHRISTREWINAAGDQVDLIKKILNKR